MAAFSQQVLQQQQKGGRPQTARMGRDKRDVRLQSPGHSAGVTQDLMFYPGLHQPGDAGHFERACISIHRLETRRKPVACPEVFVDSGAFTKLEKHGCYPEGPEVYAAQLHCLRTEGVAKIVVASTQDYMCEPFMLARTGMTIDDHQRLTIERYDALLAELTRLFDGPPPFAFMPVLQGFSIADYLRHIEKYGDRLKPGMWVGVGSVCKRQGNIAVIEDLLLAIKGVRPDLRLHGFWREAHGASEPHRAPPAAQRRQHGLVVRCPEAGTRRQRLARGQSIRGARASTFNRAGAAASVRGVTQDQSQ